MEIVRAAIDAYNRGDWDAFVKDAASDFEFDLSRAVGPNHGVFGRDETQSLSSQFAADHTFTSVGIAGSSRSRYAFRITRCLCLYE